LTSTAIKDGGTGWLVSVSNDGQTYTEERLYLSYNDLCYHCTVSDDVTDVITKTDDVMLAPVVCTRKVFSVLHAVSVIYSFKNFRECFVVVFTFKNELVSQNLPKNDGLNTRLNGVVHGRRSHRSWGDMHTHFSRQGDGGT